ncbi:MAG: TlpA disulfide reductase family protein [Deltaproteobacteria bacterium]|nr:TlpA disulfide reductase family protein [Deltaproteobacteria bacterium]
MKTLQRLGMLSLSIALAVQSPFVQAAVGARAPTFSLRPPTGVRGSLFRLSDHIGRRPVVILFWETTCAPCMQEMQFYEQMYRQYAGRLTVVAIAMDNGQTIANAPNRVRTLGLTYPVVWDENSSVKNQFQVPASPPFSVWIDRTGNIARERQGYSVSENQVISEQLARLVAGQRVR